MFNKWYRRKFLTGAVACLTLLSMLASGCATLPAQITQPKYCPQCYEPIAQLRSSEKLLTQTVATGALVGALAGAVIGLALSKGKASGALIGAGAGAVAGGLGGYALAKQQQIKDDRQRYAAYTKDMQNDLAGMDRAVVATTVAQKCYNDQFQALMEDIKAQRISKLEAEERFKEIQDGSTEISQILGRISSRTQVNLEQYNEATAAEAKKANIDPAALHEEAKVIKVLTPSEEAEAKAKAAKEAAANAARLEAAKAEQARAEAAKEAAAKEAKAAKSRKARAEAQKAAKAEAAKLEAAKAETAKAEAQKAETEKMTNIATTKQPIKLGSNLAGNEDLAGMDAYSTALSTQKDKLDQVKTNEDELRARRDREFKAIIAG